MANLDHTPVMDVTPWPAGQGFSGADDWWQYMLSQDEKHRLDHLMGLALINDDVGQRLLEDCDGSLLDAFELSEETRHRLRSIKASSLVELAQALVSGI
ncbi:MAG: hypothetical protein D6737_16500 [Chloroflexi bacterium]|nr:MAG: hypothetical protein D6737_16500 [Chloroflexota bacterium]